MPWLRQRDATNNKRNGIVSWPTPSHRYLRQANRKPLLISARQANLIADTDPIETDQDKSRPAWYDQRVLFHRRIECREPLLPAMETFILIPGRTSNQGCGISEGKFGTTYQREINRLQMAPSDMQRLQVQSGQRVRLRSEHGQIDVVVEPAKADELPAGLLFIAYGDLSSRLMGGDTHGSGMPTSKGLDVSVEVLDTPAES